MHINYQLQVIRILIRRIKLRRACISMFLSNNSPRYVLRAPKLSHYILTIKDYRDWGWHGNIRTVRKDSREGKKRVSEIQSKREARIVRFLHRLINLLNVDLINCCCGLLSLKLNITIWGITGFVAVVELICWWSWTLKRMVMYVVDMNSWSGESVEEVGL